MGTFTSLIAPSFEKMAQDYISEHRRAGERHTPDFLFLMGFSADGLAETAAPIFAIHTLNDEFSFWGSKFYRIMSMDRNPHDRLSPFDSRNLNVHPSLHS